MDFLTLYIAGKITNKKLRKRRIVLSALLGALIGTVMLFLPTGGGVLYSVLTVILGFAVSCAMTRIAFGRYHTFPQILRDSVIVWGVGALLGGIMTFLMSQGTPIYFGGSGDFAIPFALCALIASIGSRMLSGCKAKSSAEVTVTVGEAVLNFSSLCDSGSFLTDPISSLPVIIVCERELGEVGLRLRDDVPDGLKLRLIPARGIGGERLLRGFIPERITVDGREVDAVIACDAENANFSGYGGIVPAVLCK
jgi:MFS family permease